MRILSWPRFIIFLTIVIGLLFVIGYWLTSPNTSLEKSGTINIVPGTSAAEIWQQMVTEGFTHSTLPWRYNAWREGLTSDIQAGTYRLDRSETVSGVLDRLVTGQAEIAEVTITYPEGFTLEQIAERTEANGIGTTEEFVRVATAEQFANEFDFLQGLPANRTLEGYLFPDTYRLFRDDTPRDVIGRMLANFSQHLRDLETGSRTLDEIVIMASIIEREVTSDEDMALASGVLWQRFDDNFGLGADATVRYILNKWTAPLTVQDLEIDSPYNTRRYRGLTPGPISNPGERALRAAANPETSDFYYYLSAPSGETIFSRTLEEHNLNKTEYLR